MALYTKSAQLPADTKDGIRICIMRRPKNEISWDIWMPHLAPYNELLNAYLEQEITWDKYCEIFKVEVLQSNREYLNILIDLSKNRKITIICWEETPDKCHRRLVAEACSKINSQLNIIIK